MQERALFELQDNFKTASSSVVEMFKDQDAAGQFRGLGISCKGQKSMMIDRITLRLALCYSQLIPFASIKFSVQQSLLSDCLNVSHGI